MSLTQHAFEVTGPVFGAATAITDAVPNSNKNCCEGGGGLYVSVGFDSTSSRG